VSELLGMGRFKFHEGKLEEFKRLSARGMEIARTKDTGTLTQQGPTPIVHPLSLVLRFNAKGFRSKGRR